MYIELQPKIAHSGTTKALSSSQPPKCLSKPNILDAAKTNRVKDPARIKDFIEAYKGDAGHDTEINAIEHRIDLVVNEGQHDSIHYDFAVGDRLWCSDITRIAPHIHDAVFTRGWVRVKMLGWGVAHLVREHAPIKEIAFACYRVSIISSGAWNHVSFWCYSHQLEKPVSVQVVEAYREAQNRSSIQ